jgi:MerR family transcriptional regulator, mercuric resistance operon regulatory protein
MGLRAGCFSIGELSARSGVKIETLRYYERIGVLPPPPRSDGRQRVYDMSHLRQAKFVRRARDLGFSLDQIRDLLGLAPGGDLSCAEVKALAKAHMAAIQRQRKIEALKKLERTLNDLLAGCDARPGQDCPILETLSRQ